MGSNEDSHPEISGQQAQCFDNLFWIRQHRWLSTVSEYILKEQSAMLLNIIIFAFALLWTQIHCATPEQWTQRSIYQVLTDRYARTDNNHSAKCNTTERVYCGGTYRGVINNLDYIADMGFSAIWISPITYNIEGTTGWGEAYHGYWQQDLFKLNSHFGSVEDLKDLSDELHRRKMYLMVDIVVNHFAWPGPANEVVYSKFATFDSASFFHPYCIVSDYDNQTMVEQCWLGDKNVELVDVNTEDSRVVSTFQGWISSLVSNYSIDGLRIDTAKHVHKSFWPAFNKDAGVFSTGEVLSGNVDYLCDYQNYLDSLLNYAIYYPLTQTFSSTTKNMSGLISIHQQIQKSCKSPKSLLTFASNHDQPRLAALTPSLALRKNALAYTMMSDGIPTLYQGDEQSFSGRSDPDNREAVWVSGFDKTAPLYTMIQTLNKLRSWAGRKESSYWNAMSEVVWNDSNALAMRKGQVVALLTNKGENMSLETVKVSNPGYAASTKLMDVVACQEAMVGQDGVLSVNMTKGEPQVFYPLDGLSWSGICQPWLGRTDRLRLP
ncbi:alpha-amylase [Microthyrium microscopicum]|uniref:alpha-amylase n=1 Tax=Microthyrium microscopicum TaxID=703497 RepID=A0A6A6UMF4_9PEZI|nr:alpha-amylase [Microthyrium microscopicum]